MRQNCKMRRRNPKQNQEDKRLWAERREHETEVGRQKQVMTDQVTTQDESPTRFKKKKKARGQKVTGSEGYGREEGVQNEGGKRLRQTMTLRTGTGCRAANRGPPELGGQALALSVGPVTAQGLVRYLYLSCSQKFWSWLAVTARLCFARPQHKNFGNPCSRLLLPLASRTHPTCVLNSAWGALPTPAISTA